MPATAGLVRGVAESRVRITEAGEERITEDGEERELEGAGASLAREGLLALLVQTREEVIEEIARLEEFRGILVQIEDLLREEVT